MAATLASGRGALAVLPDGRAAARVDAALAALLGDRHHVLLTAEAGPERRYRRWLAVHRGAVRAVVGTRAAMFAPVRDLGLVAVWDDGDSAHSDPHAPLPHAREVLLLRAAQEGAGCLIGGHGCTVEAARSPSPAGRARWPPPRDRAGPAPLVRTVGEEDEARDPAARAARLPTSRGGRCARPCSAARCSSRCRAAATCPGWPAPPAARRPAAPTATARSRERTGSDPALRVVLTARPDWHCPQCGGFRLRAQVFGARRTAEELGRAFTGVRCAPRDATTSSTRPGRPALIVCTPGAEPVPEGPEYAAALLLDGWALLGRPICGQARRRCGAGSRRVPGAAAGRGWHGRGRRRPGLRPVQALVRWDPSGHAVGSWPSGPS